LAPPNEGFAAGAVPDEGSGTPSRPVTATQYPSHRPRQRMGLSSAPPGSPDSRAAREGTAYASVPSWSADAERRGSGAQPPLRRASLDDYEELDAVPDDEPADDAGSVWTSSAPDSWRPGEDRGASRATPPPLPPRGAFSDDDGELTQQAEAQTDALPPFESGRDPEPGAEREMASLGAQRHAWDESSRVPSWEHDTGSSWAAELPRASRGSPSPSDEVTRPEPASPEPALQSEAARAKLTARVHHQAVRVSFAPDTRVPGQYVVRPLREGEMAAAGERVALLVALEPGMPLV
jgi:hypothetical protein